MNTSSQVPVNDSDTAVIQAKYFMTPRVVTVRLDTTVRQIALLFKEKNIGAVPVVDRGRKILGMVSKGDLINRAELGIESLTGKEGTSKGMRAEDVMSRNVITVSEQTSFADVAEIMENKHIKHLPVVRKAKLVGIVSRTDVVRMLTARPKGAHVALSSDDDVIRFRVIETLVDILGGGSPITVTVSSGVVELHGTVEDESKLAPSRAAVERISHVVKVMDHRVILQPY